MINIGFTGTRKGMSNTQKDQLVAVIRLLRDGMESFIHGAAIGADDEARHIVAAQVDYDRIRAIPAKQYTSPLARNRVIVDCTHLLIAAPETNEEVLRSGTWATIRYARKQGKPIIFLSR